MDDEKAVSKVASVAASMVDCLAVSMVEKTVYDEVVQRVAHWVDN